MVLTTMLKVAIIIVLIMESGFLESIEKWITKRITKPFEFKFSKPFNCSLCLTFWALLVISIISDELSINNLFLILLVSYLTDWITDILYLIIDLFKKIISIIRIKLSL